jgi:hypothetical protein
MPDTIVNILCAAAWGAVMVMGAMWQKQVGELRAELEKTVIERDECRRRAGVGFKELGLVRAEIRTLIARIAGLERQLAHVKANDHHEGSQTLPSIPNTA